MIGMLEMEKRDVSVAYKRGDMYSFASIPGYYDARNVTTRRHFYPAFEFPPRKPVQPPAEPFNAPSLSIPYSRGSIPPNNILTLVLAAWLDHNSMEAALPMTCRDCNAGSQKNPMTGKTTLLPLRPSFFTVPGVDFKMNIYTAESLKEHMTNEHQSSATA